MAWPKASRVDCGDEDAVGAAGGGLDDLDRVLGASVDDQLGSVPCGERELVVVDVDGGDAQAHGPGVLDRDVAEPADAGDDDPLARARLGHLQALVDGDAGAEDRGDLDGVRAVGDERGVRGVDEHVLAEGAVDAVARVLLLLAQGLPAGGAELALAAGREEPGVPDELADVQVRDALAEGDDLADALVAGDERRRRLDRPVAVSRVEVGVADPAGDELDQRLAGSGDGDGEVLDGQPAAELLDDCCVHVCHGWPFRRRCRERPPTLGPGRLRQRCAAGQGWCSRPRSAIGSPYSRSSRASCPAAIGRSGEVGPRASSWACHMT